MKYFITLIWAFALFCVVISEKKIKKRGVAVLQNLAVQYPTFVKELKKEDSISEFLNINQTVPDHVDWVSKNAVSIVKNEGIL